MLRLKNVGGVEEQEIWYMLVNTNLIYTFVVKVVLRNFTSTAVNMKLERDKE